MKKAAKNIVKFCSKCDELQVAPRHDNLTLRGPLTALSETQSKVGKRVNK